MIEVALTKSPRLFLCLGCLSKRLEQLTGQTVTFDDLLERNIRDDSEAADESEYEFPDGVPDDIRVRVEQFERIDKKGRPLREIAAKYGVER